MNVLVDTCIWFHVLRHKKPSSALTEKLKDIIKDSRVVMIGPIRQELLSGISDPSQFKTLKNKLSSFEDIPLLSEYFVKAAEFSNICRKKGVQGSTTDFLICAVSSIQKLEIFTEDNDFLNYKKYLPIHIYK
ncbi:PIN domain-containing protein [Desulfobacula sp.]|uniref:type II toxin-antitoxin system VapC family toxin n=1 Tax=Desulfobacula sp. TaxID=2593537 RepID=UPI0019A680D2|nr:PIN domain-containing protein [Candidatus Brocadiales bacterium]MBL6996486.1 PIN domain-containing protein [Desulfobacula sp.]